MGAKRKSGGNGKGATRKVKGSRTAKRAGSAKPQPKRKAAKPSPGRRRPGETAEASPQRPPPIPASKPMPAADAPSAAASSTQAGASADVARHAEPSAKQGPLARLTNSVGSLFARMTRKKPPPPPRPDPDRTVALDTADIVFEAPDPNRTMALDPADIVSESAAPPPVPRAKPKRKKAR